MPRELFGERHDHSLEQLQALYLRYHQYRDTCAACSDGEMRPLAPEIHAGNEYWLREFCRRDPRTLENAGPMRPDLRDIARRIMHKQTPDLTLEELRTRRGAEPIVAVRHEIIMRAIRVGYRNVDIARFLHIHESVVSRIGKLAYAPEK